METKPKTEKEKEVILAIAASFIQDPTELGNVKIILECRRQIAVAMMEEKNEESKKVLWEAIEYCNRKLREALGL